MTQLHQVILIGALTRQPELRYTPNGTAVCDLTLAGEYVSQKDGQPKNFPWYQRVSMMGKQAEDAAHLEAGTVLFLEGRLDQRSWEDPNGQKRTALNVKALNLEVALRSETVTQDSAGGYRLCGGENKVLLRGNLTRDVETKTLESGDVVTNGGLAINESWKDKTGNWQEKTHFVNLTLWRDVGELLSDGKKGDPVVIEGRLVNETYTDREGQKRNETKIDVSQVTRLARKGTATTAGSASTTPRATANATRAVGSNKSSNTAVLDNSTDLLDEEDLPF